MTKRIITKNISKIITGTELMIKERLRLSQHMTISVLTGWLLLLTLFLSVPQPHGAETLGWAHLRVFGGQVRAIAIDPINPDVIFAGSNYGDGLFKSTSGGATWESIDGFRNEVVNSISIDPMDHNTVWVVAYSAIYKSEDAGVTWSIDKPGSTEGYGKYFSLVIDPADSDIVYVGTSGHGGSNHDARLYKSTDGGRTWQATSLMADHNVVDLAINLQNSEEIWAVTASQPDSDGTIYVSLDAGETWVELDTDQGWFWFVTMNPQNPQMVFVGGEQGLFQTTDEGATWRRFYLSGQGACLALAFDPQNPDTIYANWGNKFSRSINGGDSWYTPHSIFPLNFLCLAVNPHDPQVLYGGDIRFGIQRSMDGGQTWQAINQGIRANHIYTSAIAPTGKIIVGSQSGLYTTSAIGGWQRISTEQAYAAKFSPQDENTIFVGFEGSLGTSTDSGLTWSHTDIPSAEVNRIVSITIDPHDSEVLYLSVYYLSGNKGEIFKSPDGGETLSMLGSFPKPVNAVVVSHQDSQLIYAGTGVPYAPGEAGGVYKTEDGGQNWRTVATGLVVNALAIDPEDKKIIYAGCGDGIGQYAGVFKTINGGQTWERKQFGIPTDATIVDVEMDPDTNTTLYAATYRHGVYVSYDGGDYWTTLGLTDYLLSDIVKSHSGRTAASAGWINENVSLPSSELFVGSGSGLLKFTGSGVGLIAGMVLDSQTNLGVPGATLSTNNADSVSAQSGFYAMLVPDGVRNVQVQAEGYPGTAKRINVTSGGVTWYDFALISSPIVFSIKAIQTNATGPVAVGNQVNFTVQAEGSTSLLYYQFWVASGYGTPNYGNWGIIQEYSASNSCSWTPPEEGNYVVVAWVSDDPTSGQFQQVGMSVSTTNVSSNPVQVKRLSSDITYPVNAGRPLTFTADATGGSGPIKYQYWVNDGGQWGLIRSYSTNVTSTWTPNAPGEYIIVVWASDTESTETPPIAGWTCLVK